MNNKSNIFINSGIRDKADVGLLQIKNVKTLGYAIGYLLLEEFEYSCPILIATDTRTSGNKIKDALMQTLTEFGHDVFDAGICPTPFVAKALKDYQPEDEDDIEEDAQDDENFFTLGLVITASHNPAEYNGIKILTPFGYLDIETEEELSEIFHTFSRNGSLIGQSLPDEQGSIIDFDLSTWYQSQILEDIEKSPTKISIVLDCAHGATAQVAPRIFHALGYEVIAINNTPDGSKINQNSGCGDPKKLIESVKKYNAAWGCGFDGDGDRVIIVNQDGTVFDGDDIVYVLSNHEKYKNNAIIVGTIMSNVGLQNYFTQHSKKLIRTPVGERNLIQALIKHQAFLGAETCGHVTMMDHAFCSDGIFAALMFFQTVQTNPTLINKPYEKHFQAHETVSLTHLSPLQESKINNIAYEYESKNNCRIIVRPSNTEPLIRIMVEHQNEEQVQEILQNLQNDLIKILKN